MPSFIAAAANCKIDGPTNKPRAAQFDIEVSGYQDGNYKKENSEFNLLKNNFDQFCIKNSGKSCEMLMFTGLHGKYGNNGILNNLNKNQLQELVQIAQKNNVQFQHILADCCCGSYGMQYLQAILANGGEAICDRTTSDGHKMQDMLVEEMIKAKHEFPNAEKNLINETIKNVMNTYNCPMYLTKDNKGKIKVLGTTDQESKNNIIETYRNFGLTGEQDNILAEKDLRNCSDIDLALNEIVSDCKESKNLLTIDEKKNRDYLLATRTLHVSAQKFAQIKEEKLLEIKDDVPNELDDESAIRSKSQKKLHQSHKKFEKTLKIDKQDVPEKVLNPFKCFKDKLSEIKEIKEDTIDEQISPKI